MNTRERRKMLEQKIMGLVILVMAALAFRLCAGGSTLADRDGTGAVLMAALGAWLLLTKKIVIE